MVFNPAVHAMLQRYEPRSVDDHVNALREILQEIALCGLWRGKLFERAAFYGGSALRVLHGLDRFSEDLDFSLLTPDPGFDLSRYLASAKQEINAYGFDVSVEAKEKGTRRSVKTALLGTTTRKLLLFAGAGEALAGIVPPGRRLKIKVEVDTAPPGRFATETRFCLQPVPFSVRAYTLPSLFAGKMHALLCRGWRDRVKGRDWYDLVWYVARGAPLDLVHLEARMRQSGHVQGAAAFDEGAFRALLGKKIDALDVAQARADVERFVADPSSLGAWSRELFHAVAARIEIDPAGGVSRR